MSMERESLLEDLAASIESNTSILCDFLREKQHPQPSFATSCEPSFPAAPSRVQAARTALITAARDIQTLALWPSEAMQWVAYSALDTASLRFIDHFNVAEAVPLEGSISFSDLATKVNVEQQRLTRMIRHTMTNHIFHEPEPGQVAHTSLSAALATSETVRGQVGNITDTVFPAVAKVVEQTEMFPGDERSNNAASNIAWDTDEHILKWIANDPVRSMRFSESMKASTQQSQTRVQHVVDNYDWTGVKLLVDVGGNTGHVSKAIADKVEHVRFIVQDQPEMVEKGEAELPAELRDRITFMSHNFFESNPVIDADLYLLRWILHDWPDNAAAEIIRAISSRMKSDARLLLCEVLIPPAGEMTPFREKFIRNADAIMMAMFNGMERTLDDWEQLVRKADPSLHISRIISPEGSALSLIEVKKSIHARS